MTAYSQDSRGTPGPKAAQAFAEFAYAGGDGLFNTSKHQLLYQGFHFQLGKPFAFS